MDKILREAEVNSVSGLSRTTRWRLERENKFPKRRRLGANSIGWLESEVLEWLATRPQMSGVDNETTNRKLNRKFSFENYSKSTMK